MNEDKNPRARRVEMFRKQYQLDQALLSVDTADYRISLHIQRDTENLWCVVTDGGSIGACGGISAVSILKSGDVSVVFGRIPDTVVSVEIVLDKHVQVASSTIYIGSGVFLSSIPITQELDVTFKDQADMVVHTEHLVIPKQPPVPLLTKLKLWLSGHGWLPSATDSATYRIK